MNDEQWVERHRPSFVEIQGNNSSLKAIDNWAEHWEPGDNPQLLVGSAGTGKTSTAMAIADRYGWTLNAINASDSRKSDDIADLASTLQSNPYEGLQVCLLDEIDSLSGRANLTPLVKVLKDPQCPVFITANDKYSIPGKIKRACTTHEFSLGKRSRRAKLKKIVDKEDIDISSRDLARLTERPDLRSSINDLQRFAESDADSVPEDEREWDQGEFDVIDEMLKGEETQIGNSVDPSEIIFWIDENWRNNLSEMDKQLRGIEVAVAYDLLSRADVFLQRAQTEDYRFWRYAVALMEQIGETRITEPYNKSYISKSYPSWFRKKQKRLGDGSSEDKLYQALSNTEDGKFGIGGNYTYFRKVILPILKDLDKDTKLQIAVSERVPEGGLKALGLSKKEYNDYSEGEWNESETVSGNSAMDW